MKKTKDGKMNSEREEKAVVVGVALGKENRLDVERSLDELEELIRTAGGKVVGRVVQKRTSPDPKYFIGKGKIEEVRRLKDSKGADIVVFDNQLSPAQIKNLENSIGCRVIDRTDVILDIFALHARTKLAKLQVELAQLEHQLPRLRGKGKFMEQIEGGIGFRGPGEKKLELDRRHIKRRIYSIRKQLEKLKKGQEVRRKRRQKEFIVALVGYTNAGKSTLMKRLSGSDVLIEDKLFATLDSTIRKVWLGNGRYFLLTDTVGFINKLPHKLVEAFHSTLEEVRNADLLLHIVDITSPRPEEQIKVVLDVLAEINALDKPVITVFNKIDLLENGRINIVELVKRYKPAVGVSAITGENIDRLKNLIKEQMATSPKTLPIAPHSA